MSEFESRYFKPKTTNATAAIIMTQYETVMDTSDRVISFSFRSRVARLPFEFSRPLILKSIMIVVTISITSGTSKNKPIDIDSANIAVNSAGKPLMS